MPKDKEGGHSKNKNKGMGNPNRVTKQGLGPNNRPYATVASTGYVRTSGAHYAEARGPPAVFMSDDEEDNNVNAMMRKVNTVSFNFFLIV